VIQKIVDFCDDIKEDDIKEMDIIELPCMGYVYYDFLFHL